MSQFKFQLTNSDGKDVAPELASFAEAIGLESSVSGRYSVLLLLELFAGERAGTLSSAKVVSQIRALDGLEGRKGLKPATAFKHPPLKGLWHQHYLEDGLASMARNLQRGVGKFGSPWFEERVAEAKASGEEKFVTAEDVALIAHDLVVRNWERLVASEALTGEWIIFAEYQGKNYYLCLGKHKSGDELLRKQIDAICLQEFPFLSEVLDL